MAITQERLEQGMIYEQYTAQMVVNHDLFIEAEQKTKLPIEHLQFFSQLPHFVHVLVLTEDWCRPAAKSLPVLAKLATESRRLQLRFFLRDQNLDIMDQYLKEGVHRSIPTFVFFDHHFRELGQWQEWPAKIMEMMIEMETELFLTDPALAGLSTETLFRELPEHAQARILEAYKEFWIQNQERSDYEVVREIRAIVEKGLKLHENLRGCEMA
jgi:hypothetical protein